MTGQQRQFVNNIYNAILKYASEYNIIAYPPILAQAILESGWGKSSLAKRYHNYFGMKCGSKWKGKSVNLATKEEYNIGTLTSIRDNFRVYDTLEDGVKGYFEFINTSRYKNLKGVADTKTYLKLIKNDGYATSSRYVENLMNVVKNYDLEKYSINSTVHNQKSNYEIAQEVISGKWGVGVDRKNKLTNSGYDYKEIQSLVNSILYNKVKTHKVIKGDTLNIISKKYYGNISRVDDIMKINNLKTTCIQIGQVLKLP